MKYVDGSEAIVGDIVAMSEGAEGVVACKFDTNQYESEYPQVEWAYLEQGALVKFAKYGLIHYSQIDTDLHFFRRAHVSH